MQRRFAANVGEGVAAFRQDVVAGLTKPRKSLPCKYFYDEEGSRLFDEITELDEYYPTRTELEIMHAHAREMAETIGPQALIIEPGAGSVVKIRTLLDALVDPVGFVPVDISGAHLRAAAEALGEAYPELWIEPVIADFTRGFAIPTPPRNPRRRVVYFPGSTIGNFEASAATALLRATAELVGPQGGMLIGTDLDKDPRILTLAYDDPKGVTAAFNLNLLARINRELDGEFDLSQFEHVARYDEREQRMEMYLRSLCDQVVSAAGHEFRFDAGEEIFTEYSHKYTRASLERLCEGTGLRLTTMWTDPGRKFAVSFLEHE